MTVLPLWSTMAVQPIFWALTFKQDKVFIMQLMSLTKEFSMPSASRTSLRLIRVLPNSNVQALAVLRICHRRYAYAQGVNSKYSQSFSYLPFE
jgi:hypothetical protein